MVTTLTRAAITPLLQACRLLIIALRWREHRFIWFCLRTRSSPISRPMPSIMSRASVWKTLQPHSLIWFMTIPIRIFRGTLFLQADRKAFRVSMPIATVICGKTAHSIPPSIMLRGGHRLQLPALLPMETRIPLVFHRPLHSNGRHNVCSIPI